MLENPFLALHFGPLGFSCTVEENTWHFEVLLIFLSLKQELTYAVLSLFIIRF